MGRVLYMRCKLLYIKILNHFLNRNLTADSADEAKNLSESSGEGGIVSSISKFRLRELELCGASGVRIGP